MLQWLFIIIIICIPPRIKVIDPPPSLTEPVASVAPGTPIFGVQMIYNGPDEKTEVVFYPGKPGKGDINET